MKTTDSYEIHEVGLIDFNRLTNLQTARNLIRRIVKLDQYKINNINYMIDRFVSLGLFECVQFDLSEDSIQYIDIPGSIIENNIFVSSIRNIQKAFASNPSMNLEKARLLYTVDALYHEFFKLPQNEFNSSSLEKFKLYNERIQNPYIFVRFSNSELYKFNRLMNFLNLETVIEKFSLFSDGTLMYQIEKNLVDSIYLSLNLEDQELNELYAQVLDKVYEYNTMCHKKHVKNGLQMFCLCDTIGVGFLSNWNKFAIRLKDEQNKILSQFGSQLLDKLSQLRTLH